MKKFLTIGFIVFASFSGRAQDFHLSMYDAAPIYLNPAMTGVFEGQWRLHGHFRSQWSAVNFKPYMTGLLSFDAPVKKWGFGAQIVNYRAGIGNYNALQGVVSVAFTVPFDKNRNHNLSMGVQGGVTQKSVTYQLHTFDNQYTTANGGSFDNSLASGETFSGNSIYVPELNFGLLYYYAKQQVRLNPFIGGSVFNIIQPKESFFEEDNDLPMRIYGHAGIRINLTETFYIIPKALYMLQQQFQEWTFAAEAGYFMKSNETYLLAGLTYRAKDAFILSIGAKKANYIAKVAYDFNASTLTAASSGRGGFEISFSYMHQKKVTRNLKICPRL